MGWQNPFPVRFGGRSRKLVEDLYATARAGSGSLLHGGPGTEIDLENRVIARMMSIGWRAAQGRAIQADPRKLSDVPRRVVFPDGRVEVVSPLVRRERILGIKPSPTASLSERRMAIYRRAILTGRADRGTLHTLLAIACDGWPYVWNKTTTPAIGLVDAAWPGANGTAARPGSPFGSEWTSAIGLLTVTVTAPAGATQAQRDVRMAALTEMLNAVLPGSASFGVTIL